MQTLVKILLADHQEIFRAGFRLKLQPYSHELEMVAEASDAQEVFQLLNNSLCPDVVILDYALPGLNGIETAKKLRTEASPPHPKMIILAAQSSSNLHAHGHDLVCQAIDAGLDGYLLKSCSIEDIVDCIHRSLDGEPFVLGETIDIHGFTGEMVQDRKRMVNLLNKECHYGLSVRDIDILKHIAEGFSAKEIASMLGISEEAVTNHKDHVRYILMEKYGLHFKNTIELIVWAIKNQVISS